MTFYNNLDKNVRFDTSLYLFSRLASRFLSFSNGVTIARLYFAGKHPAVMDSLQNRATNCDSNCRYCSTSHVGAGSSLHVLLRAEPIKFTLCTDVTDVQLWMTVVQRYSGLGVLVFFLKYTSA